MTDTTPDAPLLTTPLNELHLQLGAKMVGFAGYSMPVQYPLGVLKEHLHCRAQAGLFDVSHMGQLRIKGPGIAQALEKLVPVELEALPLFKQTYAVFTNEQGGISDDLMISRLADDEFYLVVNAGCKTQDIAHLRQQLQGFDIQVLEAHALLALQGPAARRVLSQLSDDVAALRFMHASCVTLAINGEPVECLISCSGYTGEDGYEISVPAAYAQQLAQQLLAFDEVEAIGLGARDSLRLEVGLCLYGHDLDPQTSPIEAGLLWSISRSRRADGVKAGGFIGSDIILAQIAQGVSRKRVGFNITGRAPIREGTELVDDTGASIGTITSGGFGPSAGSPVAMGYVNTSHAAIGSQLFALLRGKKIPLAVIKMPFVSQNYLR